MMKAEKSSVRILKSGIKLSLPPEVVKKTGELKKRPNSSQL